MTFKSTPENVVVALRATRVIFKGALSERERKVLEMRLGIIFTDTATLEETGKEFGVTRERIRQMEAKALQKIADYLSTLQSEIESKVAEKTEIKQ